MSNRIVARHARDHLVDEFTREQLAFLARARLHAIRQTLKTLRSIPHDDRRQARARIAAALNEYDAHFEAELLLLAELQAHQSTFRIPAGQAAAASNASSSLTIKASGGFPFNMASDRSGDGLTQDAIDAIMQAAADWSSHKKK